MVEFKRSGEVAVLCRYLEEIDFGPHHLPRTARGLHVDEPAGNELRRYARLRQAQADEHPAQRAVRRLRVRSPRVPRLHRPHADGRRSEGLPGGQGREEAATSSSTSWLTRRSSPTSGRLKWADVLRTSRKTIQVKGSYGMQTWLRSHFMKNTPLDKIVREIITANGNTYTNPPANYYRIAKDPTALAGDDRAAVPRRADAVREVPQPPVRAAGARTDYYGMAAWFARVKTKPEPAVGTHKPRTRTGRRGGVPSSCDGEVNQLRTGKQMKPRYIGAGDADVKPGEDRREVLRRVARRRRTTRSSQSP